jgi:ADP-ribosylglycohydrolase
MGPGGRARGALYGLAIGDALGMPTQSLPRDQVVARYGELIGAFTAGPADHPIAAGLPAGTVTDDTEQAVLLARLMISSGGRPEPRDLAAALLAWEESMRARGSRELLGPSTLRAVTAIAAGTDIGQAGRAGTTNGAAMRITPVGVAMPCSDLGALVDQVVAVSMVTHNTGVALAGAAAVAAAVSAGIDGAALADAIPAAVAAAGIAARRGHWVAAADVATRISWATALAAGRGPAVIDVVYRLVGTSLATQESVPAAFAVLAASPDDPWLACRIAASLGGDCDTIAAIAGAIGGACAGAGAFPARARATVSEVNGLPLDDLACGLLRLRAGDGVADRAPAPADTVPPVDAAPAAAPRADR